MELKEQAKKNLEDFKKYADMYGMLFMLMEGNLLGAYRDGDFCEGDENDIDLGIMDEEFSKFDLVKDKLEDKGFECKKIVEVDGEFQGGCWERGGNHIDIMRMKREDNIVFNYGDQGSIRYDYPAHIFAGYNQIEFLGMILNTPRNIEQFLVARYGEWRDKISRDEYRYNDPKYSPNVRVCD